MLFGCDSDSSYSIEDDAVVVPVIAALSIAESAHSGGIGRVSGATAKPDAERGGEGEGEHPTEGFEEVAGQMFAAQGVAGGGGEGKAAEGECADGNVGDDDVESHHPEGKAREIDRE